MPSIAIVDDRKEKRETLCRVVASSIRKLKANAQWHVVSAEPPADERDVLHWLDENDATVLVTDWRLNEGAKSKRVVNYEADSLIREIRARRPSFPIFVVTGFEPEARAHLRDVENVFSRDHFTKNLKDILPQILRAGLRRYEEQRKLLKRMDGLARRVATGSSSPEDRASLKSLQGYFQVDLPATIRLDAVLTEFETTRKKAEALRRRVEARISREKGTK